MEEKAEILPFIPAMTDAKLVQQVMAFRSEAEEARRIRIRKNQVNRDAYHGLQDWSHKVDGQSTEFLPKVSETVEQFAAFIKRALIQFGDWFSIDAPGLPISGQSIRNLLRTYLDELPDGETSNISFATRVADGVKLSLLESEMIFKVHGYKVKRPSLEQKAAQQWRLQVDLIPSDCMYKDPTGRGLYKIYEVERDYHHVLRLAKQGVYKKSVIEMIDEDYHREMSERREASPEQTDQVTAADFRRRIVITEFWGTLLNEDGTIYKEKVLMTLANHKYIIRDPVEMPFWHGEDTFVEIPLLRDPFGVWHKALYDSVVPLNLALNEMFNLMLDGGMAAVWGIRQLRPEYLADPTQVANGIPQGKTLMLREDVPMDGKVLEQVASGEVPKDAMAMYQLLDREYNASALTNDIKMGMLPPRSVKATEVVEIQQSQSVVLDSIVSDIERKLESLIKKALLTIIQNTEDLLIGDVAKSFTQRELITLARMSKKERFEMFANTLKIKVFGLSATMARARDFQRLMAVIQVASQSQILAPAFLRRTSPDKLLDRLYKQLNLNPRDVERSEDEQEQMMRDMMLAQQMGLMNPSQSGANVGPTGEPGTPSEINQEANPTSGL